MATEHDDAQDTGQDIAAAAAADGQDIGGSETDTTTDDLEMVPKAHLIERHKELMTWKRKAQQLQKEAEKRAQDKAAEEGRWKDLYESEIAKRQEAEALLKRSHIIKALSVAIETEDGVLPAVPEKAMPLVLKAIDVDAIELEEDGTITGLPEMLVEFRSLFAVEATGGDLRPQTGVGVHNPAKPRQPTDTGLSEEELRNEAARRGFTVDQMRKIYAGKQRRLREMEQAEAASNKTNTRKGFG